MTLFVDDSPGAVAKRERVHREQLEYELDRNRTRIDELEDRNERIERELSKQVPASQVPASPRRQRIPNSRVRQITDELGTFTVGEASARLGINVPAVRLKIKALVEEGIVWETGERFMKQKIYEFVKEVDDTEHQEKPVAVQRPTPGLIGRLALPLQHEVRRAIGNGWSLSEAANGKYRLTRKGHVQVDFRARPKNATREARTLHNQIRSSREHYIRSRRFEAA